MYQRNLESNPEDIFPSATLSNANIIERVIPELKGKLKKVSEDRPFMGSDGFPRYADGSIIPNVPRLDSGKIS